jgi:uncharacterized protein YcbX
MRVRELYIYPLKSAAGMRVAEAEIDALGFVGDRRWMAVDHAGEFLSQRRITRMALIQATALSGGDLYLSAPDRLSIHVRRPSRDAHDRSVVIWGDEVNAVDAGNEAAEWMSSMLQTSARLVYCPPVRGRMVDRAYASGTEMVGFTDGFPLLVLGHASLLDINARLQANGEGPIGVERFRPNIVIEGADPFAEDGWNALDIDSPDGGLPIDIVKPCARCSIISVDPQTGKQGVEPMRTLSTYRRRGSQVYVAQNAIPRATGRLQTGARVTVSAP